MDLRYTSHLPITAAALRPDDITRIAQEARTAQAQAMAGVLRAAARSLARRFGSEPSAAGADRAAKPLPRHATPEDSHGTPGDPARFGTSRSDRACTPVSVAS